MTENLIKRFLLEKAYENGIDVSVNEIAYAQNLYNEFRSGKIQIKELEFDIWLENLKRNNRIFGQYLNSMGYLKSGQNIFEITSDKQVGSINSVCINARKKLIISQTGEGCYDSIYKDPIYGHLVANGIYNNQLIYLSRLLKDENNSFTIGYYGQEKSAYTKRVIEYYKQLRNFLPCLATDDSINVVEDSVFNGDKIYVLSYKTPKVYGNLKFLEFVETKHSQR